VDARRRPGQFILTGSQHFGLMERIGQSLAGRVGFLRLLRSPTPNSGTGNRPATIDDLLFRGGYPPVYDLPASPERWYNAYLATYVERDLRQTVNVRDLGAFQLFVRLCAGSIGQLTNLSRLGADGASTRRPRGRGWASSRPPSSPSASFPTTAASASGSSSRPSCTFLTPAWRPV